MYRLQLLPRLIIYLAGQNLLPGFRPDWYFFPTEAHVLELSIFPWGLGRHRNNTVLHIALANVPCNCYFLLSVYG